MMLSFDSAIADLASKTASVYWEAARLVKLVVEETNSQAFPAKHKQSSSSTNYFLCNLSNALQLRIWLEVLQTGLGKAIISPSLLLRPTCFLGLLDTAEEPLPLVLINLHVVIV